jgi:hypothetical protein
MSTKGSVTMHPEFSRWYRELDLGENHDRLKGRWNGVSAVVGQAMKADVETLLAVIFQPKKMASIEGLREIRKQLKDADEFFDLSGNDRELEILCGVALAVLLERNDDLAAFCALAVTSASLSGARVTNLPLDIQGLAEVATARMSEQRRKRPERDRQGLQVTPKIDFSDAKAKLEAEFDADVMNAALDSLVDSVNGALANMDQLISSSLTQNDTFIAIQDEELDLLWWVIGARSDDLDRRFDQVSDNVRSLLFAKELADATKFLPGPRSIRSLLSRAGLKADTMVTIPDAVNSCDATWLTSISRGNNVSPLVQPIHFAIERKLETGDETSWIAGWAKAAGIEPNIAFSELNLGGLFYGERLVSTFN